MPGPSCITKVLSLDISGAKPHFCGKRISCRHVRACGMIAPDPFPFLQAQEEGQRTSSKWYLLILVQKCFCRTKVQQWVQMLIEALSPISKVGAFWY